MTVRDVMTVNVAAVGPRATLRQVAECMVERGISGVPVVDASRHVLGVVSESDIIVKAAHRTYPQELLARLFGHPGIDERRLNARTAEEAMTVPAITIGADRPLAEAARLMVESNVKRLPVEADGVLVGILARGDLVRAFIRSDSDIADEVAGALRTEVGLGPDALAVEVAAGEVSVRGSLESKVSARAVEEVIRRVPGVVSVDCAGLEWPASEILGE